MTGSVSSASGDVVLLQSERFCTRGMSLLIGFMLMVFVEKFILLVIEFHTQTRMKTAAEDIPWFFLQMLVVGLAFSVVWYQIRSHSTLYAGSRQIVRQFTLFGFKVYRQHIDMRNLTWVQPKTAHVGSRKFVIDAGNATETQEIHLLEMPPHATWEETFTLGRLIADKLSIECKPYRDRIMGIDSSQSANLIASEVD